MYKFEIFQGKNGLWYWHFKSPNGRIMCQSEGYKQKKSAYKTVDRVAWEADDAEIVEVTK